jgi:hypothetical protein
MFKRLYQTLKIKYIYFSILVKHKEKLIEIIQGESNIMQHAIYSATETRKENLVHLQVENLKMMKDNLKNAKADKRINNSRKL